MAVKIIQRLKIFLTAGTAFLLGAWLYDGYALMRGDDGSYTLLLVSAGLAACAGLAAALTAGTLRYGYGRRLWPLLAVCLLSGALVAYASRMHRLLVWIQPGYLNSYDPQNPLQFFLLWGTLSVLPVGLFCLFQGNRRIEGFL